MMPPVLADLALFGATIAMPWSFLQTKNEELTL